MNLKKIGKLLTSKSVGTGPSSYEKRIYRAAVSQRLKKHCSMAHSASYSRGPQKGVSPRGALNYSPG